MSLSEVIDRFEKPTIHTALPIVVLLEDAQQLERELIAATSQRDLAVELANLKSAQLERETKLSCDLAVKLQRFETPPPLPVDVAETVERLKKYLVAFQAGQFLTTDPKQGLSVVLTDAIGLIQRQQGRIAELERTELEFSAFCAQFRRKDKSLICNPGEAANRIATLETARAAATKTMDEFQLVRDQWQTALAASQAEVERLSEIVNNQSLLIGRQQDKLLIKNAALGEKTKK